MGNVELDLRVLAILDRLQHELAEVREMQEHLARRLLDHDDRRTGGALVPLLGEIFESTPFTAADIATRALNDQTATGAAVRELLGERLTESGGLRPFGRFLARIEGVRFDGWRLVAAGETRGVMRWRVSGPRKPSGVELAIGGVENCVKS